MTSTNAALDAGGNKQMNDTIALRVAGSPFSSQNEAAALPLVSRSLQLLGEKAGLPRFMCMLTRMRLTLLIDRAW